MVVVAEVAKDAVECAGKVAEEVGKKAGNAAEDVAHGVGDAAEDVGKAGEKFAKEAGEALENVGKAGEKVVKETGDALEDAGRAVKEGLEDLTEGTKRLLRKTNAELARAYTNVEELASAPYHFIENQVDGYIAIAKDTAKAALRGKIVDVVFQLSVQPWKVQEESAFKAIGESMLMHLSMAALAAPQRSPPSMRIDARATLSWLSRLVRSRGPPVKGLPPLARFRAQRKGR